ncbi:MAG: rod shape-determining protein MreD [Pseudomonadota bacterium]
MNNTPGFILWSMRLAFVAIAVMTLLSGLLPLQTVPRNWAGPDLLFCLALAWSVRRPEYVPIWLLATVFLLADFILSRPPGLAAALILMACGNMQSRARPLHVAGFMTEWLRAAVLIVAVAVFYRTVLAILLVPTPPLGLHATQVIGTALAYPIVVMISALLFGIRMATPGELDNIGQRP